METKDLIEHLHEWHENLISELCADDVLTCDDLCGYPGPCIVIQAADLLEAQQKRIAELEAAVLEQEERENPKPLTMEELRKMDWEPVWCLCKPIEGGNGFWCICKKGTIIPLSGVRFDVKEIPHWVFLRNKPKEE